MEFPIAYERRSISGRPNYFLGGVKRQPSFFYHVSASASKRDEANPAFWSAMQAVLNLRKV